MKGRMKKVQILIVTVSALAVLTQIGFTRIHQMNGIKTLLTCCMNGVACIPFALAGVIVWHWMLVMCCGAVIGGYFGARVARKASPGVIRWIVIVVAVSMTAYFFWKTYLVAIQIAGYKSLPGKQKYQVF